MEKSILRLAGKGEQPDTVAAEYRKVAVEVGDLLKKVNVAASQEQLKAKK